MPAPTQAPIDPKTINAAVAELKRRRPIRSALRMDKRTLKPPAEELRPCCEGVKFETPGIGARHLCSVRHVAEVFGLPHQTLLNAIWEEEADALLKK